jgi:hypothetical protein
LLEPCAATSGTHGSEGAGAAAMRPGYPTLRDGFVTGEQLTPGAPWQIRIDQELRDRIRPQAPDGWLPLGQAAARLGVARQTVLNKVQRGELTAIYLTQGRRKGLRIQAGHGQAGLFDTP